MITTTRRLGDPSQGQRIDRRVGGRWDGWVVTGGYGSGLLTASRVRLNSSRLSATVLCGSAMLVNSRAIVGSRGNVDPARKQRRVRKRITNRWVGGRACAVDENKAEESGERGWPGAL